MNNKIALTVTMDNFIMNIANHFNIRVWLKLENGKWQILTIS